MQCLCKGVAHSGCKLQPAVFTDAGGRLHWVHGPFCRTVLFSDSRIWHLKGHVHAIVYPHQSMSFIIMCLWECLSASVAVALSFSCCTTYTSQRFRVCMLVSQLLSRESAMRQPQFFRFSQAITVYAHMRLCPVSCWHCWTLLISICISDLSTWGLAHLRPSSAPRSCIHFLSLSWLASLLLVCKLATLFSSRLFFALLSSIPLWVSLPSPVRSLFLVWLLLFPLIISSPHSSSRACDTPISILVASDATTWLQITLHSLYLALTIFSHFVHPPPTSFHAMRSLIYFIILSLRSPTHMRLLPSHFSLVYLGTWVMYRQQKAGVNCH